jgi:hypothetical protein
VRKIIGALLVAAALAAIGAASANAATCQTLGCLNRPQPMALVPTVTTQTFDNATRRDCVMPEQTGVPGAYGAWGNFIYGCTVKLTCPHRFRACVVDQRSGILANGPNPEVSLNSRLRLYNRSGRLAWVKDLSCWDVGACYVDETDTLPQIRPGESASVECNGVREALDGTAHVDCAVLLTRV